MQKVLVVNDDGYKAAGIRALIREFRQAYDVVAVAPDREQSWMGKSISGHHQLHLTPITYHEFDGYHVNGTPADCAQLGLYETGARPDFVLSGINHGANIGHGHILSSGTVGAALEAAMQGVPAFATSAWGLHKDEGRPDLNVPETIDLFANAAAITRAIVEKVMRLGFPTDTQVIGINVPLTATLDTKWVVTKPHSVPYGQVFGAHPEGGYANNRYHILEGDEEQGTDLAALAQGYVSIVPISLQLTSAAGRADLARKLDIELSD